MKGIILAGGSGKRLRPATLGVSKQVLPVYDKPMIYYPLSVLMLAGIKEILIISTPHDLPLFQRLLGNGNQFGIHFSYKIQLEPKGIAEAFILAEDFIQDEEVCLILGDNIFYGQNFSQKIENINFKKYGATIFAYAVNNPEDFGVVGFDSKMKVKSIEEKPKKPKSNYAITGLYFYNNDVIRISKSLKPSKRGELEISDINSEYLKNDSLDVITLGRGFAWLDTGSHNSLLEAGQFVETIEKRQGLKIACPEEIAYNKKWISDSILKNQIKLMEQNDYGIYLKKILLKQI